MKLHWQLCKSQSHMEECDCEPYEVLALDRSEAAALGRLLANEYIPHDGDYETIMDVIRRLSRFVSVEVSR